jgi:hypothetical protein
VIADVVEGNGPDVGIVEEQTVDDVPLRQSENGPDLYRGAAFGSDDRPAFEYVADLVFEIFPGKPGNFLFPDLPMVDAKAGELFRAWAGFYDDLRHFYLPLSL